MGSLGSDEIMYMTEVGKLQTTLTVLIATEIIADSRNDLEKKPLPRASLL